MIKSTDLVMNTEQGTTPSSRWVREVTGDGGAASDVERQVLAEVLKAMRRVRHGAVTLSHFEDDALYDPQVTRVMELIGVDEHGDDANDYGAEIVVVLSDGTRLTASVSSPLGRGPEAPLPDGMLRAKYTDCAGRALTAAGIEASFDMLMRLEDLDSVRELTALIQESSCV